MLLAIAPEVRIKLIQMSPEFTVFIMMNNYFHDVATAMVLSCGIIMWTVIRHYNNGGNEKLGGLVLSMHRRLKVVVTVSLVWITVSAIPRILTFTIFEWLIAKEKRHIMGLISKHVLAFVVLVGGVALWIHINKTIKTLPAYSAAGDKQT